MIFSDFYKGPRSPLAKLRHQPPQIQTEPLEETPDWLGAEYADLLSKDKTKQKEAVKRYLSDKVKTDWQFTWPAQPSATPPLEPERRPGQDDEAWTQAPPDEHQDDACQDAAHQGGGLAGLDGAVSDASDDDASDDDDARSVYSIVSEDAVHYRPRMEWTSDLSDDDETTVDPAVDAHPADASVPDKRTRRRRALREELSWNDGLACFEARRDAWTGARTVRVRHKPATPPSSSPRSPRRFFFLHSLSASPPSSAPVAAAPSADGSGTLSDGSSVAREGNGQELKRRQSSISDATSPRLHPVETLLPLGPPLLPPKNPLRASINPNVYLSLYDKVTLSNLQPACPVNLSDMVRSCVAGWKRDGEWPPRSSIAEHVMAARKKKRASAPSAGNDHHGTFTRRMSFGLLGRDDDDLRPAKGIRRSLQKALGIGPVPGVEPEPVKGG
ncbi:hypothetical protein DCS_05476 [Drechmeria coniospora]|uniref:Gag1-like clamp domain-containing protein n=1 Tax=Drechmeria coniospora TaxID=98403 RepID=A0A151GMZ2_DRECN|nr:hypothetical protein DCS_05476 [Drechmeria coniospora]KYK58460.1 hypothetical protein DCS_05476 [Drechmeria coniospora]